MKDIIGQELAKGDVVAFNPPSVKGLVVGIVQHFSPKMVRVRYWRDMFHDYYDTSVWPIDVAKLDGPAVTLYLLTHENK